MAVQTDPLQPAPQALKELVLDYLRHNGYLNTMHAFIRDTEVKIQNEKDRDGDEVMEDAQTEPEEFLKIVQLRKDVRGHLLRGEVSEATKILNERIPSVLSKEPQAQSPVIKSLPYTPGHSINPIHLSLNLRIMEFIEMCRTQPLDPPSPSSYPEALTPAVPSEHATHDRDAQMRQINTVRKLFADVHLLENTSERDIFLREIKQVSALLAYQVPEEKDPARYLSPARREDIANQIDTAILCRSDLPPISHLEYQARYTSTIWSFLRDRHHRYPIPPQDAWPSGIRLPTSPLRPLVDAQSHGKHAAEVPQEEVMDHLPFFDLHHYLSWSPSQESSPSGLS